MLWALCLSLLAAGAVDAAQSDGATVRVRLTGTLLDGGGDVTATIEPVSGAATRRATTVPTRGVATFADLAPEAYTLSVAVAGGASTTIDVSVGPREMVTVVLESTSEAPSGFRLRILDRSYDGEGAFFDRRWLQDHPSGADTWALIETAVPFVIADRMDTGGIGTGHSALLGSRGASWATTGLTFGATSILSPNGSGLTPFALDLGAVTAVSVVSGLAAIDVQSPGVQIGLTPASAGTRRHGSAQVSFTTPRMVGTRRLPDAPAINRISSWRNISGQFSGPVANRTGLLVSAALTGATFSERDLPDLWRSDQASVLGQLTSARSDSDLLRLTASAQRTRYPFSDRAQFQDRHVTERATFLQASASWNRLWHSGAQGTLSGSWQRAAFTPDLQTGTGGVIDRVLDGRVPRPAAAATSSQWELRARLSARPLTAGGTTHELTAGIDLRRAAQSTDVLLLPVVAETVGGLAARVWEPALQGDRSRRTLVRGAVYVGDHITLRPNLSLRAGVRADLERGSARGAADAIQWTSLSPRLSVHWNLGPISFFGGAGLYADPLSLELLSHGDPGESVSRVYRWLDADGDGHYDSGERGPLVALSGRGASVMSLDPAGVKGPRTFERTAGLELRSGQLMRLRGAAIWRNESSLLGVTNPGVPASSYVPVLIPDAFEDWSGPQDDQPLLAWDRLPSSFGQDAYLLTNPDIRDATYEGIEVTWHLTTRRLIVMFGATAYRTRGWAPLLGYGPLENDQNVSGDRFSQPNAAPLLPGSFFFDRSYVGKWSTTYRAPGDIRIGFSARYQDGQPFSRVVVAPDLAQGPEMLHAYRIGRTRFTYTLTLDARVEKGFSLGLHRVAVRLDVFNATQHLNEVEEDVLTTPAFRRSTAMQPPLTVRIGFTISR